MILYYIHIVYQSDDTNNVFIYSQLLVIQHVYLKTKAKKQKKELKTAYIIIFTRERTSLGNSQVNIIKYDLSFKKNVKTYVINLSTV